MPSYQQPFAARVEGLATQAMGLSRVPSPAGTAALTALASDDGDPHRFVQYAMVCLMSMVGYADRINMSVAVLGMADELGWTLQDRGASMAAFFYGCVAGGSQCHPHNRNWPALDHTEPAFGTLLGHARTDLASVKPLLLSCPALHRIRPCLWPSFVLPGSMRLEPHAYTHATLRSRATCATARATFAHRPARYCVCQVPGAIAVRQHGARVVLAWCIAAWCVCTALTPMAARRGPVTLVVVRALLGVAEAPVGPAGMHIVALWAPPRECSRAVAVQGFGFFLGTMLALSVSPGIMVTWGWPAVFYFFTAVGAATLALWVLFARDHPSTPSSPPTSQIAAVAVASRLLSLGNAQADTTTNAQAQHLLPSTWQTVQPVMKQMLSSSGAWAVFALHFLHSVGSYIALSWLPTYLQQRWGLAGTSTSLAMVPFVMVRGALVCALLINCPVVLRSAGSWFPPEHPCALCYLGNGPSPRPMCALPTSAQVSTRQLLTCHFG